MNRYFLKSRMGFLTGALFLSLVLTGCGAQGGEEEKLPVETEASLDDQQTPEEPGEVEVAEAEEAFVLTPVEEVVVDYSTFDPVTAAAKKSYYQRDDIKGIYISGHVAGISSWMDSMIELADTTELNAFVIDVKDDDGRISYKTDIPAVVDVGSGTNHIRDIEGLMDKLYEHDIYPIARIVTFKDPYLAKNRQDYAIKNKDGSLFVYKKVNWLNQYNRE